MLTRAAFADTPSRSSWPEQRREYHFQHVRVPELSIASGLAPDTYLEPNSANRIPHGSPSPHAKLVRLSSFSSFLRILASDRLPNAARQRRIFRERFGVDAPSLHAGGMALLRLIDETATALAAQGEERIKEAARFMIASFGPGQGPWWAALYHEVRADIRNDDWLAACRCLGLGHFSAGGWLLCFVYDVNAARPLYRPTCAEGNENPWHYPVPGIGGFDFGFTMSLNSGHEPAHGVPEVLHRPLNGEQARLACTGKLIRLDADVVDGTEIVRLLPRFRARHRDW